MSGGHINCTEITLKAFYTHEIEKSLPEHNDHFENLYSPDKVHPVAMKTKIILN